MARVSRKAGGLIRKLLIEHESMVMLGANPPGDHAQIRADFKKAKYSLELYISDLEQRVGLSETQQD